MKGNTPSHDHRSTSPPTRRTPLLFLLPMVLLLIAMVAAWSLGCSGDEASEALVADTSTSSSEATTATTEPTTTTTAPTTTEPPTTAIEITTTTIALPPGGPDHADIVVSVSFDGEVFAEDWGPAPCIVEQVERSVMEGTKVVNKTVEVWKWPFTIRLEEKNGVAVLLERYGYFYRSTETGEDVETGDQFVGWHPFGHVLEPQGTYTREFLGGSEDGVPDVAGTTFVFKLEGYDANGNTVELEIPIIYSEPS